MAFRPLLGLLRSAGGRVQRGNWSDVSGKGFLANLQSAFSSTLQISQRRTMASEAIVPGLVKSAWAQNNLRATHPPLKERLTTDVVIIGGGIAGIDLAYELSKAGKQVVVLEARVVGGGQTGRTTAHIMTWNDDYYYILEQKFGTEKAALVAESHLKSVDWYENVIKEEKIECRFQRVDGYLFRYDTGVTDKLQAKYSLESELAACHRLGLNQVKKVDLNGNPRHGSCHEALHFPGNGDFDPLKFLTGLTKAVEKRGGKIYENSKVMKVEGKVVETEGGGVVEARDAVCVCTNSPIDHNVAVHARQTADRSYAVGLKLPKGAVERAQWWSTASPYHYVRVADPPEGGDYEVLIVGGGDHPTGQSPSKYYDAYGELEKWARPRWPAAGEVLFKWTGQVYEPADQLGLYGPEPFGEKDSYIVTGDSGQGMSGSAIAAMILTNYILNRPNPWADIYSPKRLPAIGFPRLDTLTAFAEEVAHNIEGYGKIILPTFTSTESLAPGEGAVVQKGLHKVAAYRDESGALHQHSAICPHMKGLVQWNPNDSTFDCPCHGSIFDKYGKCINGPAKADLAPIETAAGS